MIMAAPLAAAEPAPFVGYAHSFARGSNELDSATNLHLGVDELFGQVGFYSKFGKGNNNIDLRTVGLSYPVSNVTVMLGYAESDYDVPYVYLRSTDPNTGVVTEHWRVGKRVTRGVDVGAKVTVAQHYQLGASYDSSNESINIYAGYRF